MNGTGEGNPALASTSTEPPNPVDALDQAIAHLTDIVESVHRTICNTHDRLYGEYPFPPVEAEDAAATVGRIAQLEQKVHTAREMLQSSLQVAGSLESKA